MTNTGYDPDRLSTLVLDALENPDTVDCNELLLAANDFLDFLDTFTPPSDEHLVPLARAMAAAAADWSIFQRDQTRLRNCFRACYMAYTAVAD
jgi:hypothetical protein